MAGLHGDFSTMPLKDLVSYLGNRRASGNLSLEQGAVRKQVVLSSGLVIDASSNQPRELLGQILINLGHVTEEQFNHAYEVQQKKRVFLGKILVDQGLIADETLNTALSMKFRETLLDAFQWEKGEFKYVPHQADSPPEGQTFKIDLLDIHKEGEFRETAWRAMRAVFPSGNAHITVNEQKLEEPPRPGSLDERLLRLAREGYSIDEMVLALHATDFHLYQRLYALYRQEIIRPGENSAPRSVAKSIFDGGSMSAADMLNHARGFAAAGNLRDAEMLARHAADVSRTPEAQSVLRDMEAALLELLRERIMRPGNVPKLAVPSSAVRTLPLSAAERYLLSRVDGKRDVATIVHVSPLNELEALKFFDHFGASGWVQYDA
jgi:hypothetical protein